MCTVYSISTFCIATLTKDYYFFLFLLKIPILSLIIFSSFCLVLYLKYYFFSFTFKIPEKKNVYFIINSINYVIN